MQKLKTRLAMANGMNSRLCHLAKEEINKLEGDIDRLITHAATVWCEFVDGFLDDDSSNESWRSLPDHLVKAIEKREAELKK